MTSPSPSPVPLQAGLRMLRGRFELLAVLGRGGSGVVWRAIDRREGREVALKLLPAQDGGESAAEREAEVAARVRHPGVVRVDATFVHEGWAGIAMELCVCSVAERVEDEGPLPPREALRVVTEALEALAEAHRQGVVHRDLKPHNLLMRADGSVAVADWGIARALSAGGGTRTTAAALLGTLPFLAPELRANLAAASPASDLFAMGATLAWACTGRAPLDPFVSGGESALRAVLPPALVDVVLRACAWAPGERFASAGDMREAVEAAQRGELDLPGGRPDPRGGARGSADRSQRMSVTTNVRRRVVVAGGLLVAGLFAAGGWLAYRSGAGAGVDRTTDARTEASTPARTEDFRTYEELPLCEDAPRIWNQIVRQGPRETLGSAIADVDGDGRPDLLFVNQQAETLTLWRAATGGIAGEPLEIPAARSGEAPLVADLDEDGHMDLLLSLKDDSSIGILHGRGEGRFAPMQKVFQAPPPQAMFLFPATRTMLFGNVSGQVAVRKLAPRAEDWGLSRVALAVAGWEPWAFLREGAERVLALGGDPLSAVRLDAQGRALGTRELAGWPGTFPIAADLQDPRGEDELYSVSYSNQVLRHDPTDGSPVCRFGPRVHADGQTLRLADVDGDGIVDVVGARTCAGCTSNHVVWMGGS